MGQNIEQEIQKCKKIGKITIFFILWFNYGFSCVFYFI